MIMCPAQSTKATFKRKLQLLSWFVNYRQADSSRIVNQMSINIMLISPADQPDRAVVINQIAQSFEKDL